MFLVEAGGGFVPVLNAALESPALAVYGDGRVIQYDEKKKERDVPAAYTIAKVDPALVAQFAAETEALNLIQEGTDFGEAAGLRHAHHHGAAERRDRAPSGAASTPSPTRSRRMSPRRSARRGRNWLR